MAAPATARQAAEGEQEERCEAAEGQQEHSPHPSLLQLPDFLVQLILGHLTSAADLAACAAACSGLRALVAGASWQHISSYRADKWTPALPGSLCWVTRRCPQVRHVDLSGASACSDADLLPLGQLTSLTSLQLGGLWHVTGSSTSASVKGGGSRRRGSAAAFAAAGPAANLDVLSAILQANTGLISLELSSTAVPVGSGLAAALAHLTAGAPNATKAAHGLQALRLAGCRRAGGAQQQDALRGVLLQCPALTHLDLSGCRWVTGEALPQSSDALSAALRLLPLRDASFAGCELLGGIGWLLSSWRHLARLDLSGSAVDDADVDLIAGSCERLRSLDLSACCRVKGPGLLALAACPALQAGCLTELRLADLAWVQQQHLGPVLRMLSTAADSPVRLELSSCGGLTDASLLELLPPWAEGDQEPEAVQTSAKGSAAVGGGSSGEVSSQQSASSSDNGDSGGSGDGTASGGADFYSVQELRLAGSGRLTAAALLRLGLTKQQQCLPASGTGSQQSLLCCLQELDVSHMQCLSSKGSSRVGGSSSGSSSSAAAQALATLLQAAGASLRRLWLDGCFAGCGLLSLLARCCPAVEQLSLVGCTGLGDADLAVLSTLPALRQLAVGGSSLAWHEHHALTGLTGLTRLRIARRPFLTDAQLAPILANNRGSLRHLELAGCAALTDRVLLALLPPSSPQQQEQQHQPHELHQQQQQQADTGQREQANGSDGSDGGAGGGADEQQASPAHHHHSPPPLQHLQLVCCDRMEGGSLRHLARLRSLRLGGCPAISEAALQAAAICCTQLTLLELPSHLRASSMPVAPPQAASHLRGLQVVGGLEDRGGGGTPARR